MNEPGMRGREEKQRTHAAVKAISALYKLLGWIALGVGFGFALTLFTFAANSETSTDKVIAVTGGLVCLMLTLLIFVLTYGFAETLKMLLEVEDDCSTLSKHLSVVVDRIEVVADGPPDAPKIEEMKQPPAE